MLNLPIKKYVIVGSYALNNRFAKDIDVICYKEDIELDKDTLKGDEYACAFKWEGRPIECLLADNQNSLAEIMDSSDAKSRIANFQELYAIKAGHIVFPHKQWDKHMYDYQYLRAILGDQVDWARVKYLVKLHRACTKERLKIRTPKLKGVTKEKFFDDLVKKYYVHDEIHQVMAHREKPMYTYMQRDETVECHKDLWEGFSFEQKCQTVLEEAYVIALERHIIPQIMGEKIGLDKFAAFRWAVMRICTTLCSGWFREFAVENYFTILNMYNPFYVDKFMNSDIKPIHYDTTVSTDTSTRSLPSMAE